MSLYLFLLYFVIATIIVIIYIIHTFVIVIVYTFFHVIVIAHVFVKVDVNGIHCCTFIIKIKTL